MLRAVAPASSAPPPSPHHGFFALSADQTAGLTAGSPVRFAVVQNGDISLASYRFTLPDAGTYSLDAACRINGTGATAGQLTYIWRNVTAGTSVGTLAGVSAQNLATATSEQPVAAAVLTVTGPTDVELRINSATNVSRILANATFARIIQIA